MSNRNATASWSGYSHQGKIGILIALKKINELNLEWDEEYILDYEQQEDVRLKLNGRAIEVHQVKARSSGDTIGTYISALNNFEHCEGENFLHTIVEVRNWNNLTEEQNEHGVERFDYGNGQLYCALNEIQEKIIDEIRSILLAEEDERANNPYYLNHIYDYLLGEIDDLVRRAHNDKSNHPRISLYDLLQLVINNPDEKSSELFNLRKKLYTEFEQYVYDLDYSGDPIDDNQLIIIRNKIEEIYCLSDIEFEQFLRNINPHKTGGKKINHLNGDDFFSSNSFSSVFLVVLQDVVDKELNTNSNQVPHYYKEKNYVLTTINDDERRMAGHAREVVHNRDVDFSEFETDYLITEKFSGKLAEIVKPNKRIEPDNHGKGDFQKFTSPKEMSFIPKAEAIDNLNN